MLASRENITLANNDPISNLGLRHKSICGVPGRVNFRSGATSTLVGWSNPYSYASMKKMDIEQSSKEKYSHTMKMQAPSAEPYTYWS